MRHQYKELSWQEADELLANGRVVVLDIRSEDSFHADHIPAAVHFSVQQLQDFCKRSDREELQVLVYCYHGISSQAMAQHLITQGFVHVYSLRGGFEEWKTHHSRTKAASE